MSGKDGRDLLKKPSGAEFRKRFKERLERQDAVIKKIPKLDTFFSRSVQQSQSSPSTSVTSSQNCSASTVQLQEASSSQSSENTLKEVDPIISLDDPALWCVNDELRELVAYNSIQQNDDSDFEKSERQYATQKRFCTNQLFYKKLMNGERIKRNWLVYSKSTGRVFCAPCKLYGGTTFLAAKGFDDWKNNHIINDHDNNSEHRECISKFISRSLALQRVDCKIAEQYKEEDLYWRNVLLRVVEVVKFLASRGLPIHGDNEILGSVRNGNFLGCVELISKFDPFMAEHVAKFGNKGRGVPSYLSSTTVNEFIIQLADQVKAEIVQEIVNAKYYSIIVDSTPDVSHTDQLAFVVRYVLPTGTPVERFLTFIPNCGHKGEEMANAVMSTVDFVGLDLNNCRGQSYDNASNMSGCYKGLQARIKEVNPLATYIPCAAHSLQLVGSAAAESSKYSVDFFSLEQQIYNFFSSSTKRWDILQSRLKKDSLSLKTLSTTRWSARADASQALYKSYQEVLAALTHITNDSDQTKDAQYEANVILEKLKSLEMALMVCFWNNVLVKFEEVSEKLQGESTDTTKVITLYSTLEAFINTLRNEDEFSRLENKAKLMCETDVYKTDIKRKRKPVVPFGENKDGNYEFSGRQSFVIETYYAAIDSLKLNLVRKRTIYTEIHKDFGFLWEITQMENDRIRQRANQLLEKYASDLDKTFPEECVHLAAFLRINKSIDKEDKNNKPKTQLEPQRLLALLKSWDVDSTFPNTAIVLRIFLSMAVTNCTGERSFSALKRVKNFFRSTLKQEKMTGLALLYIESEFLQSLSFDDIVQRFATSKARKRNVF